MATEKLSTLFHSLTVDVKDEQGRLLRIEIYMSIVVFLFICLAFFGWFRRISGSQVVRVFLWASYSSFYATLTYSLGLMSSATFTNDHFAIWAIVIFYMLDSTDSITAYSLQDNEHVYRCLCETFMAVIYVGIVVASNSKDSTLRISIWVLFLACLARPCIKFCALYLASKTSSWLSEATRAITDYMYEEHKIIMPAPAGEDDMDADTKEEKDSQNKKKKKKKKQVKEHPFFDMRGYHYIVKGDSETKAHLSKADFKYTMLGEKERGVITVHEIWSKSDLFPSDPTGRLKDHCLSFALFKMLRRRFAGYCLGECTSPEARDKTWAFVAERLLEKMDEDDQKSKRVSKRVFGIVELELAFVFDFFYTKYAAMLENGFPWWKSFAEVILLVYAILIAVNLKARHFWHSLIYPYDIKDVVKSFGDIVTYIVLYGFSATLLLQFYALLNSNWTKVWLLCKHFRTNSSLIRGTVGKVLFLVRHLQFVNLWSNRIGQHDLLAFPSHTFGRRLLQLFPIMAQTSQLPVPDEVNMEVLITLKMHGRSLTDGLNSGLPGRDKRKWTCELTEIGIAFNILVWHIATSLILGDYPVEDMSTNCTSALFAWLGTSSNNNENRHRKVARILSNYCAYLVASHPELLPDSAQSTKLIYDNTRADLLHLLEKKDGSLANLFKALKAGPKDGADHMNLAPLLVKAAELYKELDDQAKMLPDQDSQIKWIWEVLSGYWTEMVLYLAPCDNPDEHIKSLTRGGEFITHLWALLTHAGVLKRVPQHDHNPYNRETDYQQI